MCPPPQTRTHKGGGLPVTPLPPCPLQTQLAACAKALESSEELLETANQTLQTANNHDFIEVSPSAPTGAGLCPHPAVPGGGTGAALCPPHHHHLCLRFWARFSPFSALGTAMTLRWLRPLRG